MTWTVIAAALVTTAFLAATWDERDDWKRWFLLLVVVVGLIGMRVASYARGYSDGMHDSECIWLNAFDRKNIEGLDLDLEGCE